MHDNNMKMRERKWKYTAAYFYKVLTFYVKCYMELF